MAAFGGDTVSIGSAPAGGTSAPSTGGAFVGSTVSIGSSPTPSTAAPKTSAAPALPNSGAEIGPSSVSSLKTSGVNISPAALAEQTPAAPKTSNLFSNFTSLNNLSIPKQTTDESTEAVNTQPTVTPLGQETVASLPEGSQKVSSAINNAVIKTPADLLANTPYMKDVGVGMSQNPSDTGSLFASDLLHRLSAGLETVTGLTGGAYQSPVDQSGAAPEDAIDTGVRALSNGLGMAVSVGLGTKGLTAIPGVTGALTSFENLTQQLPLVGKYAAPFIKPLLTNAAGFAAYGQLDPNLANNIQARTKTFVTDIAEAPIYTALGALKSPAISLPASFGLGYGMALLSGASQQQAVTSGAAFAFLDGAGRADGTRPILSQDEMYAQLTTEAQNTLSQHSGMKITADTTAAELKTAWRMAAHQTHPDLGGNANDFTAAKNAYDFLTKAKTSIATEDTQTQQSIKSLKGGVQKAVDTYGPENAVSIVKDELGLDTGTAGRLVKGSMAAPELTPVPKAFADTELSVNHGTLEGMDARQPTKLSNEAAEPFATQAASTYWDNKIQPSIDAGKAIVIGGDDLKEYFGHDYNDNNHPVYSQAANQLFTRALTESKDSQVAFTAGGPGSGKTEILVNHLKAQGFQGIIYDSNFSNEEGAARQILEARNAGKTIDVYGVTPDLQDARGFTIKRENQTGRGITDNTFAHGHTAFPAAVANLLEDGRLKPDEVHIVDTRNTKGLADAKEQMANGAFEKDPLAYLRNLGYDKENVKTAYAKANYDETGTYQGTSPSELQDTGVRTESNEPLEKDRANQRILAQRGFINPTYVADEAVARIAQVKDYIEKSERTSALSENVSDAIYAHEGQRKANRERAIQILNEQGDKLTSAQWEQLYHFDENPKGEKVSPQEQEIYDTVIAPIKDALTKARDEYRSLGGHITTDLQMEHTPRYAQQKGGPIDRLLQNIKKVENGEKGLANGGLMSKSVAGGAKHRIFYALTDEDGNRTVVSIPNAKASRVTAFNKNVLTDLGPKSGKEGKTFTDEKGKTYTIDQATTKEIEANTNTRYHKNVLANYIVSYDRQTNALSALKFIDGLTKNPALSEIIMKEDPEGEPPPGDWKDLSGVMPQFRGYYAEPKLAEMLEDLSNRLKGRDEWPVFDQINNVLTSLIVMNPIMHTPNILMGAASAKAAQGNFSPKSAANFMRAIDAVKNKDELYLSYLEHGAPFMALKQTTTEFTKAVLNQYASKLEEDENAVAVAKALGYVNPAAWAKALGHLNETMTWGTNDIFFMHAILDYADQRGYTPLEAIKEVSKRMADYRIPSRIGPGKIGRALSKAAQSRFFMFGRYHYSGVIKPWVESMKDTAGKDSTWRDRRSGVRAMAYLGLMGLLVYPYIDKLLKGMTGNTNAYITDAGATKLIEVGQKATAEGVQQGVPGALQSIAQLNPAIYGALELGFNTDLFTRDPIYGGRANDEGLASWGTSMVAPLADAGRMSDGDFALSMFGIYTPKDNAGQTTLNAMKYDELPALQVQVKKDEAAGLTIKANAEMKDFNDRAIAAYNQDQLDKGLPPLTQANTAQFLTQYGIKGPGAVAMANASKLYGDGALATKQTLLQKVTKYAEAIGINPTEAFGLIFSGQHVQKVDNFAPLGPDSSIIVVRAPLAYTEGVRQSEAAASGSTSQLGGLQLDHFVPLEAGGTNDEQNLDLITTQQNQVDNSAIETPIAAALKNGEISNAHVLEYITRYKIGVLGEVPNQYYLNLYKNQYGSQPITVAQVEALIDSGKAK